MFSSSPYEPIAKAISTWLYPHAEVLIQNLDTMRVVAVFNNITGVETQKVYQDSLASRVDKSYEYEHHDGRVFQCLAVMLDEHESEVMVMRLETTQLKKAKSILDAFMYNPVDMVEDGCSFQDDSYYKIGHFVDGFLQRHQLCRNDLKRHHKLRIVQELKKEGAFQNKGAAQKIAEVLDISRATVYGYLKLQDSSVGISAIPNRLL